MTIMKAGTPQAMLVFLFLFVQILFVFADEFSKDYSLYSSNAIHSQLALWKENYPNLIRVTTAQEEYGLPAAGNAQDCPFYSASDGCPNAIFTIQDYITHPEGSRSSAVLPEVFWSGSLHGNERVGPTAVMEAAFLLLEAATCEALLLRNPNVDNSTTMRQANYSCRSSLVQSGINEGQRKWLARLLSTRRIVVVPTANALGYDRNSREEGTVDPNRDFPYDITDPTLCMQTIAARTLNEVFRAHLFQLALTFHAGMEVIGYEWGAPSWLDFASPDEIAQDRIAAAYSRYGGGWGGSSSYSYGPMNDLVYPVRGGMEDWAYAGSWDLNRVSACEPLTFNGYPKEKTTYNNSTLRSFNMLIETSNSKSPSIDLGTSANVLDENLEGNGHVSRNIRLALLSADLVEPYVSIVQVNDLILQQDIVPLSPPDDCQKKIVLSKNTSQVEIAWTVGGALTIDRVQLWFVERENIVSTQGERDNIRSALADCLLQPINTLLTPFQEGSIVGASSGTGRFSSSGSNPVDSGNVLSDGPIFRGTIQIPPDMKELVIMASARVDRDWTKLPVDPVGPNVFPQSHMANVRNNPNWIHESAGKKIQGRLNWFSRPMAIVLESATNDPIPTNPPTLSPTRNPTPVPTSAAIPTKFPSRMPTVLSSDDPTASPTTRNPTSATADPTVVKSSDVPTLKPSANNAEEDPSSVVRNDGRFSLTLVAVLSVSLVFLL